MLARKHLALAYQPLRCTINIIHRRALCTQKGKNELEKNEHQEKNEQHEKKEQGEQENYKEQKHERAYKNYKKDEWDDGQKSKKWTIFSSVASVVPWIVGGSFVVGVYVGNYTYIRYQEGKAPRLAFEHGHIPPLGISSTVPFIPKDMEISDLSKVIETSAVRGRYLVIYGEHGCGKTTLIKQTCNSDTIRQRGCVYVSIPEPIDVEKKGIKQVNAAKALVAPFSYIHRGFWSTLGDAFSRTVAIGPTPPPVSLEETLSLIERGAKEFTSLTHQQPILVIDNINYLATAEPLVLEALQDRAKEWADTRILTVVFVSSDGAAPPRLKGRSAYSRATEYFARGIPEPDAVKYLCNKLDKETAEQVVRKLTGDRLHLIIDVATSDVRSYSEIQAAIFQRMESDALKLLNSSVRNTARVVITAILNSPSKSIPFATFQQIVSATIAPGVIESNVIDTLRHSQVFFVDEKVVMFQSAGMLAYLQDNPPPPPPPAPLPPPPATTPPSTKRFWLF